MGDEEEVCGAVVPSRVQIKSASNGWIVALNNRTEMVFLDGQEMLDFIASTFAIYQAESSEQPEGTPAPMPVEPMADLTGESFPSFTTEDRPSQQAAQDGPYATPEQLRELGAVLGKSALPNTFHMDDDGEVIAAGISAPNGSSD